jgi:alkanesulfonate monooxygenase SsuD/methylene tetrahydromethanopterin reductase-like flavin-dependent oxidoreductase (luciferase family)
LTAEYADYWNTFYQPENFTSTVEALDAACAKAGREPSALQRTVVVPVDVPGSDAEPSGEWIRRMRSGLAPAAKGTSEELATLFHNLASAGVGHVQVMLEPNTMAGIDAFRPVLELLDKGTG